MIAEALEEFLVDEAGRDDDLAIQSPVCSCGAGPLVSPLTFIVKKQHGD